MTLIAEPDRGDQLYLPDGWRELPADLLAELIERLRALRRERLPLMAPTGDAWDTPSDLAADLFFGYRRLPHLRLIDQAFVDADAGKYDRILLSQPPQTGKSTTAAQAGPLWWLSRHRRARVNVASYAVDLAARHGTVCRNTIALYGDRLGLQLTRDSRAAAEWDLTTGGGMRCMGVSGSLTGFSSDLMVIDDPHKNREEANSRRLRDTVWGWYVSTVESRMARDPVICILTRWHEDDLAARLVEREGRLEEGGRWKVISIPAVAEGHTPHGDPVVDPLGRLPGEPLPHPKLPGASRDDLITFWSQKRNLDAREWISLYQQRPAAPEGTIWKWEWIDGGRIRPDQVPAVGKRIIAVDPSVAEKGERDECGIIVMGRGDDNRHGYVFADHSGHLSPLEWGVRVIRAALEWDAVEIVAEKNQGGSLVKTNLKAAWREVCDDDLKNGLVRDKDRMPFRVVLVSSRVGKRIRAEPVAALYQRDPVEMHHVGSLPDLEDQLTGWTGEDADSPDRLDALVHGATYLILGITSSGGSHSVADQML